MPASRDAGDACSFVVARVAVALRAAHGPRPGSRAAGQATWQDSGLQVSLRSNMVQGGGCCSPCALSCCVQRVWVPQVVQKQVKLHLHEAADEPGAADLHRHGLPAGSANLHGAVPGDGPRAADQTVSCTICVPQVQTRTVNVCSYQCVPEHARSTARSWFLTRRTSRCNARSARWCPRSSNARCRSAACNASPPPTATPQAAVLNAKARAEGSLLRPGLFLMKRRSVKDCLTNSATAIGRGRIYVAGWTAG